MMPRTNRRATRQRDTNVLQRLTQEVGDLKKRLKQSGSITVPITSLAPEPFELRQTIQVVVQPCEDEFVASFFDANVNASGSTETDALANLKDVMLAIFRHLLAQPQGKLGPGPRRQLAV